MSWLYRRGTLEDSRETLGLTRTREGGKKEKWRTQRTIERKTSDRRGLEVVDQIDG